MHTGTRIPLRGMKHCRNTFDTFDKKGNPQESHPPPKKNIHILAIAIIRYRIILHNRRIAENPCRYR